MSTKPIAEPEGRITKLGRSNTRVVAQLTVSHVSIIDLFCRPFRPVMLGLHSAIEPTLQMAGDLIRGLLAATSVVDEALPDARREGIHIADGDVPIQHRERFGYADTVAPACPA
jgi:hypothetical protein